MLTFLPRYDHPAGANRFVTVDMHLTRISFLHPVHLCLTISVTGVWHLKQNTSSSEYSSSLTKRKILEKLQQFQRSIGFQGATIRYLGGRGGLGRSSDENLFILHLSRAKIFSHIFCNEIYTWALGGNSFFSIFEDELIYFKILPSPPSRISNGRLLIVRFIAVCAFQPNLIG